ncbi:MAG: hypothetical protein ABEJ70_03315 [Halobacteriaceae archaeon]
MADDAGETPPDVPIHCPECDTTSRVPLPSVADAIARHNDQLHDGADVAGVDPTVRDHLADLVAADMGLTDEE